MARVKGALNTRKHHKKVLKLAKGFRGGESKLYRVATRLLCAQCRMLTSAEREERETSDVFGFQEFLQLAR